MVSGPKKPTTPSKTRRKLAFAALCVTLGALAAGLIWTRTDGAITDDFVAAVPAESALDAVASYLGVAPENWTLGARPADANTPDPERFREEIAPFLAEPAAANASDSVVFVGSSSIRLWSTLAADFSERAVLNRGFGGSTFFDLLHFHGDLVAKHRPSAVVVYEGDNDVGYGIALEAILHDFLRCLQLLRQQGSSTRDAGVIYVSPKPSPDRIQHADTFAWLRKAMRAVCASDERTRFLDVWPLMTDDAGNVRDDMYAADGGVLQEYDGIHMNALGYSAWTAELRALLDELLT